MQEKDLKSNTISDGFGNFWDKLCDICGENTLEIVRPGKIQCYNYECGVEQSINSLIKEIFIEKN